jgi:hypothetical protein
MVNHYLAILDTFCRNNYVLSVIICEICYYKSEHIFYVQIYIAPIISCDQSNFIISVGITLSIILHSQHLCLKTCQKRKRITKIDVFGARLPTEVYAGREYLERCMCDHMNERCACETCWLWEVYAVRTDDIRISYASATSKFCNEFSSLPSTLYINIMTLIQKCQGFWCFLLDLMCSPIPWPLERYLPGPWEQTLTMPP